MADLVPVEKVCSQIQVNLKFENVYLFISFSLCRPNRALDSCSIARHLLLQTLHQL